MRTLRTYLFRMYLKYLEKIHGQILRTKTNKMVHTKVFPEVSGFFNLISTLNI